MSSRIYQKSFVTRTATTPKQSRKPTEAQTAHVRVKVSSEMAGKLRKVAEVSGLSQETLAAEAIRRGIGVLTAFSNNQ